MASTVHACNLDNIYHSKGDGYAYSLPRPIVEGWLQGKGFPDSTPYTPEEAAALKADIQSLYDRTMAEGPTQTRLAVVTAGYPVAI